MNYWNTNLWNIFNKWFSTCFLLTLQSLNQDILSMLAVVSRSFPEDPFTVNPEGFFFQISFLCLCMQPCKWPLIFPHQPEICKLKQQGSLKHCNSQHVWNASKSHIAGILHSTLWTQKLPTSVGQQKLLFKWLVFSGATEVLLMLRQPWLAEMHIQSNLPLNSSQLNFV